MNRPRHQEVIITTDHKDYPIVDLQEVASTYDEANSAIRNHPVARALAMIPRLRAEIGRLRDRLARTVADLHNLIAAARATLSADADGEPDALYYIRDELDAQGQLPSEHQERP
jgi:hypothetical protein